MTIAQTAPDLYGGSTPAAVAEAPVRARPGGHRRARGQSAGLIARVLSRPMPLILTAQAALSLRLVWSNTAFMDEALYLRAGQLEWAHWLHGAPLPDFATYFSGAPVIYPPIGALANSMGGLAGARLLSLAFMLGATVLLYASAARLFDRRTAIAAAAVFAVLGPVQNLGAFATYDAMAVFLLALAAWLVICAQGCLSEPLLIMSALVMALADATKYASALWNPVIIVLAATTAIYGGWARAAARSARVGAYLALALAFAVFRLGGHSYMAGIAFTTLDRQIGTGATSAFHVLSASYNWIGIACMLAIVGVAMTKGQSLRARLTCVVLAVAAVLAPAEQARLGTLISLQKHVVFGVWFASAAAGYALARMGNMSGRKGERGAVAVLSFALAVGVFQASALRIWPNMSAAVPDVVIAARQSPGPCLASSDNVVSYYAPRQFPDPDSCTGPYSFRFGGSTGETAYLSAIHAHYFTVVEADQPGWASLYAPVITAVAASGYRLVASVPDASAAGGAPIEIWRYERPRVARHHPARGRSG